MLEIVKPSVNVDFIRLRRAAMVFSGLVIAAGLASLLIKGGPNYGIDFTGGLMVHIEVTEGTDISDIRKAMASLDVGEVSVQSFEREANEYLIRVPRADERLTGGTATAIKNTLIKAFGADNVEIRRTEMVGPRVGHELRKRGILSVLFATLAMGVYIAIRFELRFGVGAGVALIHDVLVTVGALSLYNVEFNLSIVAALLTIVGYSVNDTVVVSDRIRENMRRLRKTELAELINRSINETLSRTILTTATTLLVLFSLFLFGGGVIHGFAFTLIVGLTAGTYSSIFIASPVVEAWESRRDVNKTRQH